MILRIIIFGLVIVLTPVFFLLSGLIFLFSGLPIFYVQKRIGYKGKAFIIYKFRTMKKGADKEQEKLKFLNEADGPVFKIKNDPRFTKIGKFLCHTGLDELPQLINVIKGDMEIVGPRPLPVSEAGQIVEKYRVREQVKPGIVSPWIFSGYHSLNFNKWMESDLKYVKNKSFFYDSCLILRGVGLIIKLVVGEIFDILTENLRND